MRRSPGSSTRKNTRRNSRGSTMPMKRRLRGRSAMREERKSHRCLKSRGGWRWEQRSRKKQRNLKHGIMQSRRETRKRLTWKILRKKMYSQKNLLRSMKNFLCILTKILRKVSGKKRQESHLYS